MRKTFRLLILLSAFAACTSQTSKPGKETALEMKVDSLVQHYVDSGKVAGMAIAVVKGEDKLMQKSYGYADLAFKTPLPLDASFEIGSVTKQFTGAAVLQLAEAGKLNLDDDITKYIQFDTHGKKVTIRQLLSHTSGIKGYTEMPMFKTLSISAHKRDTLLRIVEKEPFDFNPGDQLIYNNTGFFMLGLIIEKVSGMSYEEYLQKNLFEKAGMTRTYYCSQSKVIDKKAYGYDTGKEGLAKAAYLDHTWPYAAGSLCSTAEDLVKWNRALHHGKILQEATYQEMIKPYVLNDGTVTRYAKGLVVINTNGKKLIRHGGGINGFLSEDSYYPEDDITIIVLINSTGPVAPGKVAADIAQILFRNPVLEDIAFTGDLNALVGEYRGPGRGDEMLVKIEKGESCLQAIQGGGKPKPLRYTKDGWMDQNTIYSFDQPGFLRVDAGYGYFILEKKSK